MVGRLYRCTRLRGLFSPAVVVPSSSFSECPASSSSSELMTIDQPVGNGELWFLVRSLDLKKRPPKTVVMVRF